MAEDSTAVLVDRGLRNMALAWESAAQAMGGAAARWDEAWVSDAGSRCPFLNNATIIRAPEERDLPNLTARLDEFFGARKGGSWLLWSAQPIADLTAAGYTFWGQPPTMLRLPGGDPPPLPPELRIVRVQDVATLAAFETVLIDGFPVPWVQPAQPGCLWDERVLGQPLHLFVGFVEDRPVSVSTAFVAEAVVGVYAVATLPDVRGRGYGAALTWRATTVEPRLPAMLQASDLGRPIYERLGFVTLQHLNLWERGRPERP
jgi:hypothetical protein